MSATPSELFPGTRKRDEKIISVRKEVVLHIGEQFSAGDRSYLTLPLAAKHRGERPANIVGGAGAGQQDAKTICQAELIKKGENLSALLLKKLHCSAPCGRLLLDFAGCIDQPPGLPFPFRQYKQFEQ